MIISRVPTVVGLDGFEPSTSRLSGARSNHLSYKPFSFGFLVRFLSDKIISPTNGRCYDFGGDDGNRTHDPLLAGQVLSQLSYTPINLGLLFVRFPGIEPYDQRFAWQVLSQFSYTHMIGLIPIRVKLSKIKKAVRLSDPRKLNNKRSVQ